MQAMTMIVLLNQYKKEYESYNSNVIAKAGDYQFYMDELALLSKFQGSTLNPKKITTAFYIGVVNSVIAESERIQRQQNGK